MNDAAGFFGPESTTWMVDREMVLLLGGPRALLLQIAHPAVAAGVEEHSDFRVDPIGRLSRTLDSVFQIVFGDRATARAAAARVTRRHATIRGTIDEASPSPWSGRAYRAMDPELLLWVHATLVDTTLLLFQTVVRPLERAEAERYYEESRVVGELLGIPPSVLPKTLADFEAYVGSVIDGPTLHVGRIARAQHADLARLQPSYALAAIFGDDVARRWGRIIDARPVKRMVDSVNDLVAAGTLPPRVREAYGYRWERRDRLAYRAFVRSIRATVPRLPARLRFLPGYQRARDRALRSAS